MTVFQETGQGEGPVQEPCEGSSERGQQGQEGKDEVEKVNSCLLIVTYKFYRTSAVPHEMLLQRGRAVAKGSFIQLQIISMMLSKSSCHL